MKNIIFTVITASFLVACANHSTDQIKSNVAIAESGADGACMQAIHDTAVNLEIANEMLDVADGGDLGKSDYQRGLAASEAAVISRAIFEDTCTVRSEVLAEGLSALYMRTLSMPGVNFKSESAELTDEAKPILEAMASGCPVITANSTGCSEVAGEAALLVNPRSVSEIADAMRRLTNDRTLRLSLHEKGLARAHQFTWRRIRCAS